MTSENQRRWFLKRQGLHSRIQEILPLTGERVTIGRVSANTNALPSSYVSRRHAMLTYNQERWLIKDEKSMNGLFVNEIKLGQDQSRILAVGDVIGFGCPTCKTNYEKAFIYRVCSNIEDDNKNCAITTIPINDDDEPENAYCAGSKKVHLDLTSVPKSSVQNETLNESENQPTVTPDDTLAGTSCKKVRETDQSKLQMPLILLKKCGFCGIHHCKSYKCGSSLANCVEERNGSPGLDTNFLNDTENWLDDPHLDVNDNVIAKFLDKQFDEHVKSVDGQENDWYNVDEMEKPQTSAGTVSSLDVSRGSSEESASGKSSPWNEFDEPENLQISYSQNDEVICISDDEESQSQKSKTVVDVEKEVISRNGVLNDDRNESIPDEPFFPILSQSSFEGDEEQAQDHSTSSNAGFKTKTRQSKPSHKGKKVKKRIPVTSNLKKKVKNLMGNRIPISGGGSAIISTDSKPLPKPKSSKNWDITVNRSKSKILPNVNFEDIRAIKPIWVCGYCGKQFRNWYYSCIRHMYGIPPRTEKTTQCQLRKRAIHVAEQAKDPVPPASHPKKAYFH